MFKTINNGKMPTRGTIYSAAVDVYASKGVTILPNQTKIVPLGIIIDQRALVEKFIEDDFEYTDNDNGLELAKKIYPKDYGNWINNIHNEELFEFECYKEKPLTEEVIKEMGRNYPDNYAIRFYKYKYEDFMNSHYIQLSIRSSLAVKGLSIPNGVGIIDMDYDEEIGILLHNNSKKAFYINEGNRVGQLILLEHQSRKFGIETTEKRVGGFGSTGA